MYMDSVPASADIGLIEILWFEVPDGRLWYTNVFMGHILSSLKDILPNKYEG
jgi:hypothetical protein